MGFVNHGKSEKKYDKERNRCARVLVLRGRPVYRILRGLERRSQIVSDFGSKSVPGEEMFWEVLA
jgi:hypothetical protein